MENLTALLTTLAALSLALVTLINNIYKSKAELSNTLPKKIKKQCNVDTEITQILEDLKEFLLADRIQIYDFHNRRTLCKRQECIKNKLYF